MRLPTIRLDRADLAGRIALVTGGRVKIGYVLITRSASQKLDELTFGCSASNVPSGCFAVARRLSSPLVFRMMPLCVTTQYGLAKFSLCNLWCLNMYYRNVTLMFGRTGCLSMDWIFAESAWCNSSLLIFPAYTRGTSSPTLPVLNFLS